jgi:hypothetical protein
MSRWGTLKVRDAFNKLGVEEVIRTVVVLRADSPGKAAQWFAESIPES